METEGSDRGHTIELALPVRDGELFRHGASEHVLNLLADNPDLELSIGQLAAVVPYSNPSTRKAVDVLEANRLVTTTRRRNARLVGIDRSRLDTTTDPIVAIPQPEFQLPVRLAKRFVESELDGVAGIVLFGSVARGEADRQSDVDLWVLVGEEPARQQHRANELAKELGELQIPASIDLQALTGGSVPDSDGSGGDDRPRIEAGVLEYLDEARTSGDGPFGIENTLGGRLDGPAQRYSFEIVVESPDSLAARLDEFDPELFSGGITLFSTPTLESLKSEVLTRD